ncbi:MAG: hypothetical protein ACOX2S_01030 [bacterium]
MADVCGKRDCKIANTREGRLRLSYAMLILTGMATGVVSIARGTDWLGLFVVFLGSVAFLVTLSCSNDPQLNRILLVAFALRLGLALMQTYILPLPDSDGDALTFERLGWQTAEAWFDGAERPILRGAYRYSEWIACYLLPLRSNTSCGTVYTNVLVGTLTVYVTCRLSFIITEARRPALMAALGYGLVPCP